jgi:TatD DNase family protein
MTLFDTHAHLESDFKDSLKNVLKRAKDSGVGNIISVASDPPSIDHVLEIIKMPSIYGALGIHPHEASLFSEDLHRKIIKNIENPKIVAIGETGLDFYYDHSPRNIQKEVFLKHIEIAKTHKLPLIIHVRNAYPEAIELLTPHAHDINGVIHCFSGNLDQAKELTNMGFYLGLTGTITFPKADETRDVAENISLDNLLVETDCPYLAPVPMRGKINEPAFVRYTAEKLAEIKKLSLNDIARITALNAHRLFNIPIKEASKIIYPIRKSLYLNITNQCTNECIFCVKRKTYWVKGHYLKLSTEPSTQDILSQLSKLEDYNEVVFVGVRPLKAIQAKDKN